MGRWGYRLFEADQDLDHVCDLTNNAFENVNLELSQMVHQTDMLASSEAREYYKTDEYKAKLADTVARVREKLDSGLGDQLIEKLRSEATDDVGKYRVILAGALLMRAGAKIKPDDLQHLRDLVPQVPCRFGWAWPMFDHGFREPGKKQFLAALDNYVVGTPRNYNEPSCFNCGKVEADLGYAPLRCAGCRCAWYCGTDCQRQQRRKHKPYCKPLGISLNV